jgi:hypothetical protein
MIWGCYHIWPGSHNLRSFVQPFEILLLLMSNPPDGSPISGAPQPPDYIPIGYHKQMLKPKSKSLKNKKLVFKADLLRLL